MGGKPMAEHYMEILTECKKCGSKYSRRRSEKCPHTLKDKLSEQLTETQIKEFWEGHGLTIVPLDLGHLWWVDKDGNRVHPAYKGNPPIDPNNLLRYAVPELKKRVPAARVYAILTKWADAIMRGEDPALALFWALQKVKEG